MSEKVALYVRVSTTRQELEGQERALREDAERRGWEVVEVYREKITATGKATRGEYERAIRDASSSSRTWTTLSCWALDRWSREVRWTKAVDQMLDFEKRHGIRFHFLEDSVIDTPLDGKESMLRDFLLGILPVVAKWEAMRISERVRVAMTEFKAGRRKTKSGRPYYRPRRIWQKDLENIVRLRDVEKLPWRLIAKKVNLPLGSCSRVYSLYHRGLLKSLPSQKGSSEGEGEAST